MAFFPSPKTSVTDHLLNHFNNLTHQPTHTDTTLQRFYAFRRVLCVFVALREIIESGMNENAIAKEIVDAAFRIHTTLGPGLLESVLGYGAFI